MILPSFCYSHLSHFTIYQFFNQSICSFHFFDPHPKATKTNRIPLLSNMILPHFLASSNHHPFFNIPKSQPSPYIYFFLIILIFCKFLYYFLYYQNNKICLQHFFLLKQFYFIIFQHFHHHGLMIIFK